MKSIKFDNDLECVSFQTDNRLSSLKLKKEYAAKRLLSSDYQNCSIRRVYVNGVLVMRNVTVYSN